MEIADPRVHPALVPAGSRAVVIAKDQPQYLQLPSVRTPAGQVITRWSPNLEERAALAQGEDIFITIFAKGAIQPLMVTIGQADWNATEVPA